MIPEKHEILKKINEIESMINYKQTELNELLEKVKDVRFQIETLEEKKSKNWATYNKFYGKKTKK